MRDKESTLIENETKTQQGGDAFNPELLARIGGVFREVEKHTLAVDPSHADEKSPELILELKRKHLSGKVNGLRKDYDDDTIKKHIGEFVRSQTEEMSDNIYKTPALDNDFFNKFAVSGEKMPLDDLKTAFQQFRSMTDMTRGGVNAAMIANHGNNAEREALQNRYEEGGGKDGVPHIELLDQALKAVVDLAAGKDTDFSPEVKIPRSVESKVKDAAEIRDYKDKTGNGTIFSSTLKARMGQNLLYSGKLADKEGITGSLTTGNHPEFVAASVDGSSAAHEGKAPFMLGGMLEIARNVIKDSTYPEEGKQGKIEQIRPYFDDHLGKGLVSDVLGGKFEGQNIMDVIQEQKQQTKKLTPEEWEKNRMEITELAHSNDANEGVVKAVMSQKGIEDMFWAYDAAKRGYESFIQNQGEFWNGIVSGIEGKKLPKSSDSKSTNMQKSLSYSDAIAIRQRRRIKEGGSFDTPSSAAVSGGTEDFAKLIPKLAIERNSSNNSIASSLSSSGSEADTKIERSSSLEENETGSYRSKRMAEINGKKGFSRGGN